MEATYETEAAGVDTAVDQLQPADTLIDRGVADALDEGFITPDGWSPAQGFGNTPAEMRQGETLDMRVKQELPEKTTIDDLEDWNPLRENRQVGATRAGRLVDHAQGYDAEDDEAESIGQDVGLAGGAACAEEAAMHIIDENHLDPHDD